MFLTPSQCKICYTFLKASLICKISKFRLKYSFTVSKYQLIQIQIIANVELAPHYLYISNILENLVVPNVQFWIHICTSGFYTGNEWWTRPWHVAWHYLYEITRLTPPSPPTSAKLVISGLLGCSGSDARPVTRGLTQSTGRARLSSHHFHRPPRFPQAPGVNILPTMWEIIAEKWDIWLNI